MKYKSLCLALLSAAMAGPALAQNHFSGTPECLWSAKITYEVKRQVFLGRTT